MGYEEFKKFFKIPLESSAQTMLKFRTFIKEGEDSKTKASDLRNYLTELG